MLVRLIIRYKIDAKQMQVSYSTKRKNQILGDCFSLNLEIFLTKREIVMFTR